MKLPFIGQLFIINEVMTMSVVPGTGRQTDWRSIHRRRSSLLRNENLNVLTKPTQPVTFSYVQDTACYFQWRARHRLLLSVTSRHRPLVSVTCRTPPVTFSNVHDTFHYFQWRAGHSLLLSVTCTTPPITFSDVTTPPISFSGVQDLACYFQ